MGRGSTRNKAKNKAIPKRSLWNRAWLPVLIIGSTTGGYLSTGSSQQWLIGLGSGLLATVALELRAELNKKSSPQGQRRARLAVLALVLGTLVVPPVSRATESDAPDRHAERAPTTSPGPAGSMTSTQRTGEPGSSIPSGPMAGTDPEPNASGPTSVPPTLRSGPTSTSTAPSSAPVSATAVAATTTIAPVPVPTVAPTSTSTTQVPPSVKAYNFNAQASASPYATYKLTPRQYVFQPFAPRVGSTTFKYFRGFHFVASCSTSTCVAKVIVYLLPSGTSGACVSSTAFGIRQGWNEYDVARGRCALDPSRTYYVQVYATEESVGTISLWLANNAGRDSNLNAFAPGGQTAVAANSVLDSEIWLSL